MTTARVLVVLGVATLAALLAPDGASAQAADPVAYTFRYDRPGDDIVVVEMTPPRALPDAGALVMPRAIPMGYGEQRYDAFVADVVTIDAGGARTPGHARGGPALAPARRHARASTTASICGAWSARCARRPISRASATATSACSATRCSPSSTASRPARPACASRARTAGRCSARWRRAVPVATGSRQTPGPTTTTRWPTARS